LNTAQLQIIQNSFHTLAYSVYRQEKGIVYPYRYLAGPVAHQLFPIRKAPGNYSTGTGKRNIVVFIMESIPADFFETGGKYRVTMPFLDSLVNKSTYYENAFSYSHNSNKAIVAILAGIPTLTEIPLYHSNYASLAKTSVGATLSGAGYHSAFFIGDGYDDFGFAKCCNWMGIQHYYCKDDMPPSNDMHTMGLHDKDVLNFMKGKIDGMPQPFFAVNYNISTHFPNDLPHDYHEAFPGKNFTGAMKAMNYYNQSLQQFFRNAETQSWFANTVFIFCSDHWMYPDESSLKKDVMQSFRIPVFVYDPAKSVKTSVRSPVSQLDILNTILAIAGVKDTVISYGETLPQSDSLFNRVVFSKENSTLYQVFDSSFVLGFNAVTGKAEFCYNYRTDHRRQHNLANQPLAVVDSLTLKMKAFLQVASHHYNRISLSRR
jgi:phosphoglycerol transferase MdoB-like AlkP superfamily enzyme